MKGRYEEQLKSGGILVVTENSWHIQYYFPGPDLRYNGTHFSVNGSRIDNYIKAWINNFACIKKIQSELPECGNFECKGEMDMYIHVNRTGGYVTIDRYHFPVSNESTLHQVINDYAISKKKAELLMNFVYEMEHIEVDDDDCELLKTASKQEVESIPLNHYSENDIAIAYNLLFELNDTPFTTRKALKLFNGLYDEKMLNALKQAGILFYNKADDDWFFYKRYTPEGRKGALWVINYHLKFCDPQLLEVAEYYVMKRKTDFDYIQEKLNLPIERMERIIIELKELGIIKQSFFGFVLNYTNGNDIYDYIISNCYNIFNKRLIVNDKP